MKVLVIGYAKTGTKTMHAALNILGYKVYDFEHNCCYLGKQWLEIISEKGGTKEDFYNMYKDVDATMDIPACNFWEEILEAFPDTKLIFSERTSEEEWWKSLKNMWDKVNGKFLLKVLAVLSPTARFMFNYSDKLGPVCFGAPPQTSWDVFKGVSPNVAKLIYRNHNARVKQVAPKDQLLVFNPSEGWDPLCKFLGKPVPDRKFPHKNKGGIAAEELLVESPIFQRMKYETLVILSVILCIVAVAVMYFVAS